MKKLVTRSLASVALAATFTVGVVTNTPVVRADCGGMPTGGCKESAPATPAAPTISDAVIESLRQLLGRLLG